MRLTLARQHVPIAATVVVCTLLYVIACVLYGERGFFSWGVLLNFLRDNAVLGLTALGMTFVILSGGIDLSVGAVVGTTAILVAVAVERLHVHPAVAILAVLLLGTLFGAFQGGVIHLFRLPPFLVTLAGMFLARGIGFVVSLESVSIRHPWYQRAGDFHVALLPLTALLFLVMLLIAVYLAHATRFGRNVYALGGSESSALLMGLPAGRTKVQVYALSGFCAALAGVAYTFYTYSGNASAGLTLELDAIAAVVIGGTLLSGGVGYVLGTLVGVLIYGIIQTAIAFEGTLSSWWTKIAIGALLLAFVLLQKLVQARARVGR